VDGKRRDPSNNGGPEGLVTIKEKGGRSRKKGRYRDIKNSSGLDNNLFWGTIKISEL